MKPMIFLTNLIVALILFSASPVLAEIEVYAGIPIDLMGYSCKEPVFSVYAGHENLKAGFSTFDGGTYVSLLAETTFKALRLGIGYGYYDGDTYQLDGNWQFTLRAGLDLSENVSLMWMHYSNGAAIFQYGDDDAFDRNMGLDFVGLAFRW